MQDVELNLILPQMLKALHTCRMRFDLTNTYAIAIVCGTLEQSITDLFQFYPKND